MQDRCVGSHRCRSPGTHSGSWQRRHTKRSHTWGWQYDIGCSPSGPLNSWTESLKHGRERDRLWGNYLILMSNNMYCTPSDSLASLSHIQTCTINSPHHTNPRRCQWGSSFFASRWSWPGIPPSRRNRHTETKSSNQPSKQLKRYLWCGIWADVMHAHVQSSYRMCQSIWLWELMKHDQGNTKVCTSLLIFVNMACHWLIGVGCDLPLCWFIVITFIMNGTRWVEFTPSDWVFNL